MALSDCSKCWDTPCTCGHNYRNMTSECREELAAVILGFSPAAERAARESADRELRQAQALARDQRAAAIAAESALAAMRAQCEGLAKELDEIGSDCVQRDDDFSIRTGLWAESRAWRLRALASGSAGGEAT